MTSSFSKDRRYVQKMLGHSDYEITERYLEDYDLEEKTFELIKGKRANEANE